MKIEDLPEKYQRQIRTELAEYNKPVAAQVEPERESKASVAYEKGLQTLCEQELSRRGIEYLHISHRAREKKGWPDLVFALAGRAVAVELKSRSGKLSADQERVLANMRHNGWAVHVVREFVSFVQILRGEL